MKIKVSNASILLKNDAQNLKGIINLYLSALISELWPPGSDINLPYESVGFILARRNVYLETRNILSYYEPDIKAAEDRLQQFQKEQAELKEIDAYFQSMNFIQFLFAHSKERRNLRRRARKLRKMKISAEELLNIAFYKFSKINGSLDQFKNGFLKQTKLR